MEITNQVPANNKSVQDNKTELRSGQVVSATVKERISDKEAILSIRGQEVRATFEGKIPEGERLLVEVKNTDNQGITVKAVEDSAGRAAQTGRNTTDNDIKQIAQNFGEKLTAELRQALRMIIDAGIPMSKEVIQETKAFLNQKWDSSYSSSQIEQLNSIDNKLATLQMAITKNIGLSNIHLQAVHEVLNGSSIVDSLKNLQNEFSSMQNELSQASRESYLNNELLQTLGNLKTKDFLVSVVTKKLAEIGNEFKDFRKELNKNLDNLVRLVGSGARNSSQLALRMIEPTMKLLDKVLLKSDILLFTDMKTEKTLMKASADMATARNLLENGNRNEALQIIRQVQNTIGNLKWQPSADRVQRFAVESQHRMEFLRQPTEQQLSQAANQYSLPIDKGLSGRDVFAFMRSLGMNHESEAAQRLVSILNSNEVLSAGQQLSNNQVSTQQAGHQAADSSKQQFILSNVLAQLTPQQRTAFEALVLKLTNELQENTQQSHIQQGIKQATQQAPQQNATNQLLKQLVMAVRNNQDVQPLVRQLQMYITNADQQIAQPKSNVSPEQLQKFEQLFKLFDRSTWNQFESFNRQQEQNFNNQNHNLKSTLMELLQQSQLSKGAKQAEQALSQLTGQQLLSKFDNQSNLQSILFSLPVIFKEQVENLKVFVNGQSKADAIDWENCSIYFLLDTKRIGTTGIQITAANRNISVTVKNDRQGLKKIFDPFIDRFIEKLDEIGYKTNGVKFAPLTEPKENTKVNIKANPAAKNRLTDANNAVVNGNQYVTQKGFDFKI
jgi:hypothetical protein